ncbi:VIT1/CCC1 transporter family protein [Methanoregula sp.]|uniref:VIT1/CCC1 transporter family protein n=1 Tax=Methanoregula sp. TaxID=2052170 RepID=UPI003C77FCFE
MDPYDPHLMSALLSSQRGEITEHHIYLKIASVAPDPKNRGVLEQIAAEEMDHYGVWKRYTRREIAPDIIAVWFYYLMARFLGITFTLKLMESIEKRAQAPDPLLRAAIPEIEAMLSREEEHEKKLIALIDEERLRYMGSVVLGLNDALVEFTGMLAGLTFALQNSQIIAVAGLITGVAAALSMGSSEYLSQKSDGGTTDPKKAAIYTGFTYMVTVVLLIMPFLVLGSPYIALVLTLLGAVAVIFFFTYYIGVAKDLPFRSRFVEMLAISFGIAAISFVIGLAIRLVLNVNV